MQHFLHCQENATFLSYPKYFLPVSNDLSLIRRFKTCAVIGAGVMGQGIALCFLKAGYKTILVDKDVQSVAHGLSKLWETVHKAISRQQMESNIVEQISDNLIFGTNLQLVKDADIIVEAVFEDMTLKKDLFKKLDAICKRDTLIVSNTSTLDISSMANATKRPETVVGLHFFNPAHLNILVEVIYTNTTDKTALNTVVQIAKQISKTPVIVGNAPGFCGNRMSHSYFAEALKLIGQGIPPEVVDETVKRMGFPMGPFQMQDLIGLDTMNRISGANAWNLPPIVNTLCKLNRYGRKSGKGWYLYKDGRRQIDKELAKILLQHHSIRTLTEYPVGFEDTIKTLMYPMINEGFKIMEDRVVAAPEGIDLIWLLGYGWPLDKGGPMYWAEKEGLGKIVLFMNEKGKCNAEPYWQPCNLLKTLAKRNIPYAEWSKFAHSSKL